MASNKPTDAGTNAAEISLVSSLKESCLSDNKVFPLEVVPLPSSLPTTISRCYKVLSVPTDCWVQLFGDRIVLGVSQLDGRVGTFLTCEVEESVIDNSIRYHISTLLGKRDDAMLGVYARRVTERIVGLRTSVADPCPPVLFGLSLGKNAKDPEMFQAIVDLLLQLYQEAIQMAAPAR